MATDPFGRALLDHYHERREEPLRQRDGETVLEHPIEQFYFGEYSGDSPLGELLEATLSGPLLDMGAGAGRHALYFQSQFETVAIEVSESLVSLMESRGVDDARQADMFALTDHFERNRFESALAYGTQIGLARSMDGLTAFLNDLSHVIRPTGTAVLDCYDPTITATTELLGYRSDETPGLGFRVMTFEYEGTVGQTLLFRLFSPERLREATDGTPWTVSEIRESPCDDTGHYLAVLERE